MKGNRKAFFFFFGHKKVHNEERRKGVEERGKGKRTTRLCVFVLATVFEQQKSIRTMLSKKHDLTGPVFQKSSYTVLSGFRVVISTCAIV